jgi:hypothetical protein
MKSWCAYIQLNGEEVSIFKKFEFPVPERMFQKIQAKLKKEIPLCDCDFTFNSKSHIGKCPVCGHHLSLNDATPCQTKYKVITLCGSTRFKDEFMEAQKRLTLEGNIVISVGLFGHSGDQEVWTEGTKEMLDDMHKRKIDMADEIFVINVGGYIGDSTKSEIEYAKSNNKKINYLEN